MKRLLLFCLTALFSVTTWAYEFEVDGIYYNALSANTAEVTYASDAYNSYSGAVSIPETVANGSDEYTVVSIGNYAFNSCTGLTSISISKNVTSIGEYAFTGCTGLTSLTIPGNVTSIGTQAFASCGIKELTLEDGTEDLVTTSSTSANTFTNCEIEKVYLGRTLAPSAKAYPPLRGQESLTTAEISSSLSSIYQYCFYGCSSLKEINIPNSITEIADYTFYGCSSLTNDNLTLPETMTAIGAYGFYGCTGLTAFYFTNSLSSLGNYAFAGCTGVEGALTVPSSITSMGQYAFRECTGLTTVSFASDDSPINVGLFYGCSALIDVTLPSNITTVNNYVFQNCSALEDITIPSKVTSIGQYTFKACSSLKSIEFEDGSIITSTGNYAFQDCIALEEIEFPSGLTSLGTYNFHGCTGLKKATVNEGLTTLTNYTFYGCSSLAEVSLPESLTTINSYVFQNCTSLKEITLPVAVSKLNTSTFNGCTAMEQLFSLNTTPPSASSNTFTNVPSTCYIIVPTGASATYAKTNYWKNFTNIIEFTPIVEDIEVEDITENSAIFSASYTAGYYETIEKGFEYWATEDDVKTAVVEGGDMKVEVTDLTPSTTYTYRAYAKVQEDNAVVYSESGTFTTWDAEEGTPLADGEKFEVDGIYYTVVSSEEQTVEVAWGGETQTSSTDSYVGEIIIPETTTYENVTYTVIGIGNSAFRKCAGLTKVTIPETVTYYGVYAFRECSSLDNFVISDYVTSIGNYSFYQCSSLSELKIPDSVTSLGTNLCYDCTSLTSISLGKNIDTIGNNAFYGCSALTEVEIPGSASPIGISSFRYCTNLEKVTIESGATQINNYAFADCPALKSFEVPESPTKLGDYVFLNDTGLEEVTIGVNIESIGKQVFKDCSSLASVTALPTNPPSCGTDAFSGIASNAILYVQEGYVDTYKGADTWQDFYDIRVIGDEPLADGDTFDYDGIIYKVVSAEDKTVEVTYYGDSYSADDAVAYYTGNITIPASFEYRDATYTVIGVGDYAFYKSGVLSISFDTPSNVTYLGTRAMYNCTAITELELPEGVLTVGDQSLRQCTSMTTLKLPETVTYLGEYLCWGNTALKAINIPSSVTTLGKYVFYNCSAATELTLSPNITEWGGHAFYDCEALTHVDIPEGITEVGEYAFSNCDGLVSISIPDEVTTLGAHTFAACSKLESCVLPESMTEVDGYLFYNCPALTEVTIGSNVESFGSNVFAGCPALAAVYSLNPVPPTINSNTFSSTSLNGATDKETCVLYVPCGSEEDYASADNWSAFSNIVGYDCPDVQTFDYTLDPPEGEVSSLHSITISYEDGVKLNVSESKWGNAKVYDANGDEVVEVIIATPIGNYGQTYTGYNFTLGLDGSSQDVTEAGDYYFVIPEGYISFYNSTNDEWVECEQIIAHYVIEGEGDKGGTEAPYTVEPAEGTVESLSYVKFIDEGAICYTEEVDPSEVKVYKDGDMSSAVAYGVSVEDDHTSGTWDDAVKVTFNTTLTVAGEYTVVVPAGLFNIGSWTVVNDEITLNYTVDGSANTGTFVCDVDPADGAKVTKLDQIIFTNPSGGEIFINEEIWNPEINVYDEGGVLITQVTNFYTDFGDNWEELAQISMFGGSDDEGNVYPSEITAEGTYYVSVPANVFFIYDEGGNLCYNESMSLTYTVSADAGTENPDYTLSFSPEDGSTLDVLSTITISCEDGITQVLMPDEEITITDDSGNSWSGNYTITEVANDLGIVTQVVITLSQEIVEAGTYYVNVPWGYFDINQHMNEAFTLTYTITGTYTGIGGISINDENVEGIYSTSGQKLNSTQKGVNIVRYSDGTVKKIYIK